MPPDAPVSIIILVADAWRHDAPALLSRLRAAGVKRTAWQEATGTIAGEAAQGTLDAIRRLPGVEAVEVARSFQLPRPDSPVQ